MRPAPADAEDPGPAPAVEGEFRPLRLGFLTLRPPVVLAPMAGVTNWPFRALCRRFGAALFVSEMVTARGLVEGHGRTTRMASFGPGESPRSIQLYGTDPASLAEATRRLVDSDGVDHIDLNFGCPVRKVTARGGGAAIPARPRLMARLLRGVVRAAGPVPVTVKFRTGIDSDRLTSLEAGRVAEAEGAAWVALHARTAAQLYDGEADWTAIGRLKSALRIPVLGNGDIFEAWDALRMMRETGCDGVVIGRGCLGRPWLFRELAAVFDGRMPPPPPCWGEVALVAMEHARRLVEWAGEAAGMQQMRKFNAWYTKGFPGGAVLRERAGRVRTLSEEESLLAAIPPLTPFPAAALRVRRCKRSGTQRVSLPPGWMESPDDDALPDPESETLVGDGG